MIPTHNKIVKCQKCQRGMMFIKTAMGKFMPVDARAIKVVTTDGQVITAYAPHWGSCTDPAHFRKIY